MNASEARRGFGFWGGQCLITVTEDRGAFAQRVRKRRLDSHPCWNTSPPHTYNTPGPACVGLAISSASKWNVGQGWVERWWLGYRAELLSVEGHWHGMMWTPLSPVPMTRVTLL